MNSGPSEDAADAPISPRAKRRVSAEETRERRRTFLVGALATALCMLLVNAVVGENGYLATLASRREEAALRTKLALVRLENQQLQQSARRLADDPAALEEAARRELGLMKPGETLLVIRDSKPAASTPSSK